MLRPALRFVGFVAVAAASCSVHAEDPPAVFDKRPYAEAKKAAESAKKWFIVKATAVWCMPCKQMDKITWRDEKVVKWLKDNAIVIAIDVDKEKTLAKKLAVAAMPSMIAFRDGKEFDRVVGYKSAEDFLAWLEGIARGEKAIDQIRKRAGDRVGADGKVDIMARLELARALAQSRKYDEATDEYAWLWDNMLEHDAAFTGVRVSFMASEMEQLAEQHSGATKKFKELRDRATKQIGTDKAGFKEVKDWVALNRIVGDRQATLVWYDEVKDDPRRARLVQYVERDIRELLIEAERWADVGLLYEHPIGDFEREHASVEFSARVNFMGDISEEERQQIAQFQREDLRRKAGIIYAALLAADREDDAREFAMRARELDESNAMLYALITTALRAKEPRAEQIQWKDKVSSKPDDELARLKVEVQRALEQQY